MIGDLLASFCERGQGGGLRYLELWRFPDGTLNVVANKLQASHELEYSFPCGLPQMVAMLDGRRPFRSEIEGAKIVMSREEDQVRAEVTTPTGETWTQQVSMESVEAALLSGGLVF